MPWGQKEYCGDCNQVKATLKAVDRIYSIHGAFAAVLKDGTVLTYIGS